MLKKKFLSLHSPMMLFILLLGQPVFSQAPKNIQQEGVALYAALQKYHVSPKNCDDILASQVFQLFLKQIDGAAMILTQEDIQTLAKYEKDIDQDFQGKSWVFLPTATELYKTRLQQTINMINRLLEKPFDYTQTDSIFLPQQKDTDMPTFVKDTNAQKQKLFSILKYSVLKNMVGRSAENATDEEILASEQKVRESVLKKRMNKLNSILNHQMGFENHLAASFFNALTYTFDPHSVYLSKAQKSLFMKAVTKDAFTFGIEYSENDEGQLEIKRLVPGSAAWNSGKLNEGDILIKVKTQQGNEIDLTESNQSELIDILYSDSYKKIELTVQKADGLFEKVMLIKEKAITEENIVHSLVLTGEKKIGYIYLPGFYHGQNERVANGCANDVAKEIKKLKEEGIEGLIFDIRFNGGGALYEGLDMAGIFVNEGPLSVINMKGDKPRTKLDPNRGTIWDGPLLLMVNGESASASEVLASTLKDYNRALIVGSRTFGKATGQVMFPIDTTGRDRWGDVLVTIEKLYRVTGKSVQAKGLNPDIVLPDLGNLMGEKEGDYTTVLPNDSIIKDVNYAKLAALPINSLAEKSQKRVAENERFAWVESIHNTLSKDIPVMKVSLRFEEYREERKTREAFLDEYEKVMEQKSAAFETENHTFDKGILTANIIRKESNEAFIRNIASDIYVEECYNIMQDWLNH